MPPGRHGRPGSSLRAREAPRDLLPWPRDIARALHRLRRQRERPRSRRAV